MSGKPKFYTEIEKAEFRIIDLASRLGTASAPIVAGIYQPSLAPVGLLLAIMMNIIGTTIGLAVAQACHLLNS